MCPSQDEAKAEQLSVLEDEIARLISDALFSFISRQKIKTEEK